MLTANVPLPLIIQGITQCNGGEGCHLCHWVAFEAWERMTYGGLQLDSYSRVLLDWINDVRFEPYGENYWRIHVAR
jgi:hypothetical protein